MVHPCPHGASDACPLSPPPADECSFYSPMKRQCMMSSRYEDDEMEGYWWDCYFRRKKMKANDWNIADFRESVKKCLALERGWLDGDGERISETVCRTASQMVEERFASCPPHVFPMESGGLSLEWDFELDCGINPDFSGFMLFREKGKEMDWNDPAAWDELANHWQELVSAAK